MRVGTVYYDANMDQTIIKWNDTFLEQDWLLRADVLKDLSHLTNKRYEALIDNMQMYDRSE